MSTDEIATRFNAARKGNGWHAKCPAHEDSTPSLSISEGTDGRVLLKCFAGCSTESIVAAIGLKMADLFPRRRAVNNRSSISRVYDYVDADGAPLFQCVRFDPKDFKQRRPDPDKPGNWIWNLTGISRVLFHLPAVKAAVSEGRTIFVAEGERDVEALAGAGFVATCNPMGAGKWLPDHAESLRGAGRVVVIADRDKAGREHAQSVAGSLQGLVKSVRLIELPDRGGHGVKDSADFFAAGGSPEELKALVNAEQEFSPATSLAPTKQADLDQDITAKYGRPIFFKSDGSVVSLNERFFSARFHRDKRVIFEPGERSFYRYGEDTGLWQRATDDHIRESVSAHVLEYGRENEISLESKITAARMAAILQALRGISETRDAFIRHNDIVHVKNGVVRFDAENRAALTDFRSEDFSRNRCPIDFIPDADCPRFINDFLAPVLPDDDIDLLQRWAGLTLAGINPAQRLVILDGGPATGKSTFARIMQMIGVENTAQLRTDLLTERFELFRFVGRTLLLAPDCPGDFLSKPGASALKAIIGGDALSAEAKGSNAVFSLHGCFNVLITSNSRLRVRLDGDAGAWRRRIIIIRFDNPSPIRRIPNLAEQLLRDEGPGILRWMLNGFMRARQEIAKAGDLTLSDQQRNRVDALLSESDSLRRFIRECTEQSGGDVTTSELTEAYFRFCSDREWTPQPAKTVERNLKDLILESHQVSQSHDIHRDRRSLRGWRGVNLKQTSNSHEPCQDSTLQTV